MAAASAALEVSVDAGRSEPSSLKDEIIAAGQVLRETKSVRQQMDCVNRVITAFWVDCFAEDFPLEELLNFIHLCIDKKLVVAALIAAIYEKHPVFFLKTVGAGEERISAGILHHLCVALEKDCAVLGGKLNLSQDIIIQSLLTGMGAIVRLDPEVLRAPGRHLDALSNVFKSYIAQSRMLAWLLDEIVKSEAGVSFVSNYAKDWLHELHNSMRCWRRSPRYDIPHVSVALSILLPYINWERFGSEVRREIRKVVLYFILNGVDVLPMLEMLVKQCGNDFGKYVISAGAVSKVENCLPEPTSVVLPLWFTMNVVVVKSALARGGPRHFSLRGDYKNRLDFLCKTCGLEYMALQLMQFASGVPVNVLFAIDGIRKEISRVVTLQIMEHAFFPDGPGDEFFADEQIRAFCASMDTCCRVGVRSLLVGCFLEYLDGMQLRSVEQEERGSDVSLQRDIRAEKQQLLWEKKRLLEIALNSRSNLGQIFANVILFKDDRSSIDRINERLVGVKAELRGGLDALVAASIDPERVEVVAVADLSGNSFENGEFLQGATLSEQLKYASQRMKRITATWRIYYVGLVINAIYHQVELDMSSVKDQLCFFMRCCVQQNIPIFPLVSAIGYKNKWLSSGAQLDMRNLLKEIFLCEVNYLMHRKLGYKDSFETRKKCFAIGLDDLHRILQLHPGVIDELSDEQKSDFIKVLRRSLVYSREYLLFIEKMAKTDSGKAFLRMYACFLVRSFSANVSTVITRCRQSEAADGAVRSSCDELGYLLDFVPEDLHVKLLDPFVRMLYDHVYWENIDVLPVLEVLASKLLWGVCQDVVGTKCSFGLSSDGMYGLRLPLWVAVNFVVPPVPGPAYTHRWISKIELHASWEQRVDYFCNKFGLEFIAGSLGESWDTVPDAIKEHFKDAYTEICLRVMRKIVASAFASADWDTVLFGDSRITDFCLQAKKVARVTPELNGLELRERSVVEYCILEHLMAMTAEGGGAGAAAQTEYDKEANVLRRRIELLKKIIESDNLGGVLRKHVGFGVGKTGVFGRLSTILEDWERRLKWYTGGQAVGVARLGMIGSDRGDLARTATTGPAPRPGDGL